MDAVIQLLNDLAAIDSINPDLSPGGAGEGEIARFIGGWMERAGLEVHYHEVKPGRPNVVGVARGSGDGKTLLFNGHIDTVGVDGMARPFEPIIRAGRLYARGGYDMKAGLAAALTAAAQAARRGLRGDVIVAGVIDEEYAGLGTADLVRHYRADAAIVAEPTGLELIVAHKGFAWFEIETRGVKAHGSLADVGVDAIAAMGAVLTGLQQLDRALTAGPLHPLLGRGSVHASLIQGGQDLATYPDRCLLALERRALPGETPEVVEAQLNAILEGQAQKDPAFKAVLRRVLYQPPMQTPPQAAILPALEAAARQVLGRPVERVGAPYWTDAATLANAGIPSVLFGPVGGGAHTVDEWVDLESAARCAEIYLDTALRFCG